MLQLLKQRTHFTEPSEAETPFNREKQEWSNRVEYANKLIRNYRIIVLIALAAVFVQSAGLVYLSNKMQVKPIIVRVNQEGMPISANLSGAEIYQPTAEDIRYFLSVIVKNTRRLLQDPVAISQGWNEAYVYLTDAAKAQMSNFARSSGIAEEIQKIQSKAHDRISRTVTMRAFLPITEDTYQLRWTEVSYSKDGFVIDEQEWSGNFTIKLQEPTDKETAFLNPRGLYVKEFSISRDLD